MATINATSGPLAGVKVIDATTIVLGPYATQMLGDMGADIIKIEAPGAGDLMRNMGPGRNPGMSGLFLNINRNKRSVVLDLKQQRGKQVLRRLIQGADVFFHNMRAQAIAKLGFDYAAVRKLKQDIVYCGAFGYASSGPYAARPAYDDLIQGVSGAAALSSGQYGSPRYMPTVLTDKLVALMANQAILAALFHRSQTGQGQAVEVPMFESAAAFLLAEHLGGRAFEPPLSDAGNARVLSEHRKPMAASDGYICILPYTDANWAAFFDVSERPELAVDARFAEYVPRMRNIDKLYALMAAAVAQKSVSDWASLCDEAQIPWAPVNTLDDLFEDPHLDAVGFFHRSSHPTEGETVLPTLPTEFSETPTSIRRHAPYHGEHSEEVLAEFGFTTLEVEELKNCGVLGVPE